MLGEKLRESREVKGLLQREVAEKLHVDAAYLSKVESNEKRLGRHHLTALSRLLDIPVQELQSLWLANKIFDLVKDEKIAISALEKTMKQVAKLKKGLNK